MEVICIADHKMPHHLISQDAAEFVLVQKQQPLQTDQLIGLQLEPEGTESFQNGANENRLEQANATAVGIRILRLLTGC